MVRSGTGDDGTVKLVAEADTRREPGEEQRSRVRASTSIYSAESEKIQDTEYKYITINNNCVIQFLVVCIPAVILNLLEFCYFSI